MHDHRTADGSDSTPGQLSSKAQATARYMLSFEIRRVAERLLEATDFGGARGARHVAAALEEAGRLHRLHRAIEAGSVSAPDEVDLTPLMTRFRDQTLGDVRREEAAGQQDFAGWLFEDVEGVDRYLREVAA
jgi:hypothetical protein